MKMTSSVNWLGGNYAPSSLLQFQHLWTFYFPLWMDGLSNNDWVKWLINPLFLRHNLIRLNKKKHDEIILPFPFWKDLFLFLVICLRMYTPVHAETWWSQRQWMILEMELQDAVSCPVWALPKELKFSASHWAVSPFLNLLKGETNKLLQTIDQFK